MLKTEPTKAGGIARLRRCDVDGRFWTSTPPEKLDQWLPATATDSAGNGDSRQAADRQTLGGLGGSPSALVDLSVLPGSASSKPSGARALKAEPPRFGEFWVEYPRKVARAAALKMWISRQLDHSADLIIAAIRDQAIEFRLREPDKVPHAATWLNGERWKDEVDRRPRPVGRPARHDGNLDDLLDWRAKEAAR